MALLNESAERIDGILAKTRRPMSWAEECLRNGVERFFRARQPGARLVHELVMDRGKVRADVAAIGPDHLCVAEIKSEYDNSDRLINQLAMFRLSSPELWVFAATAHRRDCELMAYLMPTLGFATASEIEVRKAHSDQRPVAFAVHREATLFRPDPECLLSLLWVAELTAEAVSARIISPPGSKPWAHRALVKECMAKMSDAEMLGAVCRQLRARNAEWRADPPVRAAIERIEKPKE